MTCYDCAKPEGHEPECPTHGLAAKLEAKSWELKFGGYDAARTVRDPLQEKLAAGYKSFALVYPSQYEAFKKSYKTLEELKAAAAALAARLTSKCDMSIGPCACGAWHSDTDERAWDR